MCIYVVMNFWIRYEVMAVFLATDLSETRMWVSLLWAMKYYSTERKIHTNCCSEGYTKGLVLLSKTPVYHWIIKTSRFMLIKFRSPTLCPEYINKGSKKRRTIRRSITHKSTVHITSRMFLFSRQKRVRKIKDMNLPWTRAVQQCVTAAEGFTHNRSCSLIRNFSSS